MMRSLRVRAFLLIGAGLLLVACGSDKKLHKGDEALGLDPEDSPAELYVRMAEEYYSRGQTEVAFRRAQQAIEADKKYPRAQAWVAFLYEEIGKMDEAERHYARAVDLAPNNSDIRNAYGSFKCRQLRYAEADEQFRKALDNPLYVTPWIAMTNAGNCAMNAGNSTQAETYYRDALRASPTFGPALAHLAELTDRQGDARAAKGYLDRYFEPATVRTVKASYIAVTVGAQVERKLGNRKRADYYEKVLKETFQQAPKTRAL